MKASDEDNWESNSNCSDSDGNENSSEGSDDEGYDSESDYQDEYVEKENKDKCEKNEKQNMVK